MMKECVASCKDLAEKKGLKRPYIIGVTILTSLGEKDLIELGFNRKIDNQVLHLAHSAKDAGLEIGSLGGISVNEYLQTSDPDI